jgi:hypothetical protein
MIEILGSPLYQWDTKRTVSADIDIDQIHLSNPGDAYAAKMDGSTVAIPDSLLQSGKPVNAYAVRGGVTVESKTFPVHKRERPENYVYDEDRRNFIYELIANAEKATQGAEEAAGRANDAADRAIEFSDDVEAIQSEIVDLRTDFMWNEYDSAGNAVRAATIELNARIQEVDAAADENAAAIKSLDKKIDDHTADNSNPHRVTCAQIGAVTQEQYDGDMDSVRTDIGVASDDAGLALTNIADHAKSTKNPHQVTAAQVGAVTRDQHDDDIAYLTQEMDDLKLEFYERKDEVDKKFLDTVDELKTYVDDVILGGAW